MKRETLEEEIEATMIDMKVDHTVKVVQVKENIERISTLKGIKRRKEADQEVHLEVRIRKKDGNLLKSIEFLIGFSFELSL